MIQRLIRWGLNSLPQLFVLEATSVSAHLISVLLVFGYSQHSPVESASYGT
jgi:hypothetical protein